MITSRGVGEYWTKFYMVRLAQRSNPLPLKNIFDPFVYIL